MLPSAKIGKPWVGQVAGKRGRCSSETGYPEMLIRHLVVISHGEMDIGVGV